jgi:TRAP-type C4-dicarboxylate transport system permease small subunit
MTVPADHAPPAEAPAKRGSLFHGALRFLCYALALWGGLSTIHGFTRIATYEMKGEAPQGIVLGTFICAGVCVLFIYLGHRLRK